VILKDKTSKVLISMELA